MEYGELRGRQGFMGEWNVVLILCSTFYMFIKT